MEAPVVSESKVKETVRRRYLTGVFLVLISGSTGFFGGWLGARDGSLNSLDTSPAQQIVSSESQLINSLVREVGPSVVSVEVMGESDGGSLLGPIQMRSAGTGIIISSNIIITNRHVVPTGSNQVSVTLSDGTTLENVSVLGRTSESDSLDIAFLKVNDTEGKTLKTAKIGDSSRVEVGDRVIAIGNALGQFQNTVTDGIISGYGRNVEASQDGGQNSESLQNLFQTDAAINQGNSGGPLINMNGEVIGINTAIADSAQNIGFAIPINDAKGLIKSVLEKGQLLRPYLGVRYVSLTDDAAEEYKLSIKRGAYIVSGGSQAAVIADSPASKAGLKEGDIIVKVNNTNVNEKNSLASLLGSHSVGDKVQLTILRNGKEIKIEATLAAAPANL